MSKTIYVNCSFCAGMMEVDVESGKVIQKWAPGEKDHGGDKLSSTLKKLEDDKKKRQGLFDQKRQEMEGQKKEVENVFQKEVERIKKEGIKENPRTPFDLD